MQNKEKTVTETVSSVVDVEGKAIITGKRIENNHKTLYFCHCRHGSSVCLYNEDIDYVYIGETTVQIILKDGKSFVFVVRKEDLD